MTVDVKSYTYHLYTGPVVETVKRVGKITLDTDKGWFQIKVPPEAVTLLGLSQDKVSDRTLDGVKKALDEVLAKYQVALMNTRREKVIVVQYKWNREGWYRGNDSITGWAHAPVPNTLIALEYEVLIKIGNHIYEQQHETFKPHHRYSIGKDSSLRVIPWTEERELFFEQLIVGMTGLIERLANFLTPSALTANLDLAIAHGGGLAALPSPTSATVTPLGEASMKGETR